MASYSSLPTHNADVDSSPQPEPPRPSPYSEATRSKGERREVGGALCFFLIVFYFFILYIVGLGANKGLAGNTCRDVMLRLEELITGKGQSHRNTSTIEGELPTHFVLPSGDQIPAVGLGVWGAGPDEVQDAIMVALKAGYRHIDGAWVYGNEAEVGRAIKASGVPRQDIWITSKLWNVFHNPEDVEPALDYSLRSLGTEYLDLYLMHWPVAFVRDGKPNEVDEALTANPYPTWQKMEELVLKGKVRNIGISNFNINRIRNLTGNPLRIQPAVNQVELSYWIPQPELLEWAKENKMLLVAYSPLGSAERVKESLKIPEVLRIAKELGLTPAQVYISWHIQRGTVVLPKSVTPSRIKENFQVTLLPQEAFNRLEVAAASHEPSRSMDPSKDWGVDIFQDT